ncbi:transposase [Brevibacterium iodinum]|uniref:transposase n=1 Tax=Brevibacterium iodinum TaxID=31943 RepID=UPI003B84A0FA
MVRFRLNRSGDRRLNSALYMVAITRLSHHQRSQEYMAKRLGGLAPMEYRTKTATAEQPVTALC